MSYIEKKVEQKKPPGRGEAPGETRLLRCALARRSKGGQQGPSLRCGVCRLLVMIPLLLLLAVGAQQAGCCCCWHRCC